MMLHASHGLQVIPAAAQGRCRCHRRGRGPQRSRALGSKGGCDGRTALVGLGVGWAAGLQWEGGRVEGDAVAEHS
eukprot:1158556-Pelagomonas_calceolata.AAC.3